MYFFSYLNCHSKGGESVKARASLVKSSRLLTLTATGGFGPFKKIFSY
jgi:hypothetical protein